jgi:phage terminase large subunit
MKLTKVGRKTIAAWKQHPRYISSCGGTRSGKTYSILQTFIIALVEEVNQERPATINSVVSESMPHLQRGAIRDFKQIMEVEGLWEESRWNETQHTYTWQNGSILEFFSVDNAGKVHGSARDRLFINESQNIPYEIARQLFVRTRGLILCDYNPTHSFWLNEVIEARQNCITLHSTYKDNEFLSPEQIAEIEDNKNDKNWWQVYGEGKIGTLDGLIYEFETCDALPEKTEMDHLVEIQGLDFGFTNDPTARVQVVADHRKKILWVRQRCYRTHMQNKHIIQDLQEDGVSRNTEIYADCAEPKSIADIQDAGYNVIACDKDAPVKSDKLKFQLQWMQGWQLNVTKDSIDLIRELRNYVWAKDRDGNPLNEPIDKFNHLLDAMRYAVWTRFGQNAGYGQYSISFINKRHGHH